VHIPLVEELGHGDFRENQWHSFPLLGPLELMKPKKILNIKKEGNELHKFCGVEAQLYKENISRN